MFHHPLITVSVVSHAQGDLLRPLLAQIGSWKGATIELILTLNLPEDENFITVEAELPIKMVRNLAPRGFGANHNRAFEMAAGEFFLVLNPDIRCESLNLQPLLDGLKADNCSMVGPRIVDTDESPTDSPRRFPTLGRLFRRLLLGVRTPEYETLDAAMPVDWVGGMFMLLRCKTYRALGGFDERFYMYMEDVDLCRRIRDAGQWVCYVPTVQVFHDAQRQNRRSPRHMSWHLRSLMRYLLLYRLTKHWA